MICRAEREAPVLLFLLGLVAVSFDTQTLNLAMHVLHGEEDSVWL